MAEAQYIAGMGFSNVGLGIVHSMAHPLGAFYDTPHGVANATLLPYVMEYNAESPSRAKYLDIARAMGVKTDGMSVDEGVRAAVDAVKALSLSIRIPQRLHELGVREEDIPALAVAAFNDVCTGGNPASDVRRGDRAVVPYRLSKTMAMNMLIGLVDYRRRELRTVELLRADPQGDATGRGRASGWCRASSHGWCSRWLGATAGGCPQGQLARGNPLDGRLGGAWQGRPATACCGVSGGTDVRAVDALPRAWRSGSRSPWAPAPAFGTLFPAHAARVQNLFARRGAGAAAGRLRSRWRASP